MMEFGVKKSWFVGLLMGLASLLVPSKAMELVNSIDLGLGTPYRLYIHVEDDIAYVGDYTTRQVLIYDVSNKDSPQRLSSIQTCSLFSNIHDIWYDNGFVYTAHRHGGLTMIDVSNPLAPSKQCKSETYSHKGLITVGDYLFYSGRGSFSIYDISVRHPNKLDGTALVPGGGDGFELVVTPDANYAYRYTPTLPHGYDDDWIGIYDVSDKENPHLISSFYEKAPDNNFLWEMEISPDGKYLYAQTRDGTATARGTGVDIYDIEGSNAINPVLIGTVSHRNVYDISLDHANEILYVRNFWDDTTISAYDVSDPTSPNLVDSYPLDILVNEWQQGDLWYSDGYVYAVSGSDLVILSGLQPNTPPEVEAGPDMSVYSEVVSSTVIEGSATGDEGDTLFYQWLEGLEVLKTWTEADGGLCPLNCSRLASPSLGAHTLTLEVDDGSATSSDVMTLTILNSPPIAAPTGGGTYNVGDPVTLSGEVSDFDGDLLYYQWLRDGTEMIHDGTIITIPGGEPVELSAFMVDDLNLGMYSFALEVDDGVNDPESSAVTVEVDIDTAAPTLAPIPSRSILWPPNKEMVEVTIEANANDASGSVTLTASVESNEQPVSEEGDWSDPVIAGDYIYLVLRADRFGNGDGRVYSVRITASDGSGNNSTAVVEIVVPHDKGKKKPKY